MGATVKQNIKLDNSGGQTNGGASPDATWIFATVYSLNISSSLSHDPHEMFIFCSLFCLSLTLLVYPRVPVRHALNIIFISGIPCAYHVEGN